MIKKLTSLDDIDALIGNMLVAQSDLTINNVVNAKSDDGPLLESGMSATIIDALAKSSICIVFDITSENNATNLSYENEDDTLDAYQAFNCKVTIYGDTADLLAIKLKARIETQKCRDSLFDNGIHFKEITVLQSFNEFINDTVWVRAELEIKFDCVLEVTQISKYNDIESLNTLDTINVN